MTPGIHGPKIPDKNIQFTGVDSLVSSAGRKLKGARLATMMSVSKFVESCVDDCASGIGKSAVVPFNSDRWEAMQAKIKDLKQNLEGRVTHYHPKRQDAAAEISKIESAEAVLHNTLEHFDFLFDSVANAAADPSIKNTLRDGLKKDIIDILKIDDEFLATAKIAQFQEEESITTERPSKPLVVQLDVLNQLEEITGMLIKRAEAKGDENTYADLMKAKDELDFLAGAAGPVEVNALEYAPEQDIQDHLLNVFPYLRDLTDDANVHAKLTILERYLTRAN